MQVYRIGELFINKFCRYDLNYSFLFVYGIWNFLFPPTPGPPLLMN